MKRIKKNAFTLVKLLAVIVILAIILVIAVPRVMSIIGDAKKGTLESTVKMIASSAEKAKVQNTVLGNTEEITCESVTKLNNVDYDSCSISFDGNTAKVTIKGKGKFAGLNVCGGTKIGAAASEEECGPKAVSFKDDDWETIVAAVQSGNHPYQVGDTKSIDLGNDLGTHTIRVANTTSCEGLNLASQTACGFVLEFADIITTHVMNENDTCVGGWPASEMRTYVNSTIYNALPEKLRNGIIYTYVISNHGTEDMTKYENLVDGFFYSTDKLYLFSLEELFGIGFLTAHTRELDYYATYEGVSQTNYDRTIKKYRENNSDWWVRSCGLGCLDCIHRVLDDGDNSLQGPSASLGVSPAFRLAE